MGRSLRVIILVVMLAGCGSGPSSSRAGFLNQTRHADADLWTLWRAAQTSVAQEVDLNPLQRSMQGALPDILPGDSRALTVTPHELAIGSVPDVPSSVLLGATGVYRDDPTGMIACPQPCNVRYAAAYSRYQHPQIRYAASWESQESNFALILQYEFESQILFALGYDVKWR